MLLGIWFGHYWVLSSFFDHYIIVWRSYRLQAVPGNGACLHLYLKSNSVVHLYYKLVKFKTSDCSGQRYVLALPVHSKFSSVQSFITLLGASTLFGSTFPLRLRMMLVGFWLDILS